MRILIYGSTYLTELCVNQLKKDGYNLVGYIPSKNPIFKGRVGFPEVNEDIAHDIKLSIQYDDKISDIRNAYNLHTGLLPEYGGCSILYQTLVDGAKEQGLTFHKMGQNFDEGEIISKMTYAVLPDDTVKDLYSRIALIAPKFISNALSLIKYEGEVKPPRIIKRKDVPQDVSDRDRKEIEGVVNGSCKIIALCFAGDRDVRTNVSFPAHNQDSPTPEKMLQLMKDVLKNEMKDSGIYLDTYIVNSDVGFKEGNDWLDSIHGTKTENGNIYVIHRPNKGGSFGAYRDAFHLLKDKYRYFLFTEEDLLILGRDYYKKAIERLHSEDLGFLAFIDVERYRNLVHAHGGVGLTTREVLNHVVSVNGDIPHPTELFDKRLAISQGEIPFTNIIDRLGYKMARMGEVAEWSIDNYCIPYYNYHV